MSSQTVLETSSTKGKLSLENIVKTKTGNSASDSSLDNDKSHYDATRALRPPNSRTNSYKSINQDQQNDYTTKEAESSKAEQPWYKRVWSVNTYENDEERKFVRKLDMYLLTWGCISYIIKNVDQSNYKNAYVSGMKEDLNMDGYSYNLLSTFFTIGYAVAAIPCQLIMTRVKASYFMGGCELVYGICTALCAIPSSSPVGLYPLRFIIGMTEASSWSGMMVIFFSYYNNHELGFRAGLLGASAFVGQAITGFLQAGIYKNLNGAHGIPGWKWLYIINGACMTIPVALCGMFVLPDTPANGGAKWMSKKEVSIALKRVQDLGRVTQRRFKLKEFVKAFADKKLYYLLLAYMPWDLGLNATSYINLWLKSVVNSDGTPKYSVEQVNLIPVGGYIIGAVGMVLITKLADVTQKRIHALVFQQICGICGCIILSIWPRSLGAKYFGFFIMFLVQSTGAILMSFVPEIWARNPERRAVITSIIVVLDFSTNSWLPLLIWPAQDAPNYKYGYKVNLGFEVLSLFGCIWFYFYVYMKLKNSNELESQKKLEQEANEHPGGLRDLIA